MDLRPYLAVATIQMIYVGLFMFTKAALNQGMNSYIFVFYRQAFATIFLVPLAIIFERKKAPPLSFVTFCKIFMFALFGITISLNVSGIGLLYTTPSLAAAIQNTIPAITFFLAILLRIETVKLRSFSGGLKIFGVMVCLAGAATLAFYKGPHLKPLIQHRIFGQASSPSQLVSSSRTWVKGCFLMLAANVLWGLWFVLQGMVLDSYPSKLLFTTLLCFISTIQTFFVAFSIERNAHAWKLHFDVQLLAVVYCGITATGVVCFLLAWCIEKKGPLFASLWTPLSFITTTLCSVVFFGEAISYGSVLGGVLLVGGLYSVLCGKNMELKEGKVSTEEVKDNDNDKRNDQLGCDAEKGVEMI